MTNPEEGKLTGADNEKNKSELDDSIAVEVDPADESKAQLIGNGGAGGDEHQDGYKVVIAAPGAESSDGEVSFNGLGKDEVLRYANDPFWVKLRWILFILFWVGWFAMLVTAVAIIVLAPRCPHRPDLKWYHTENIYQVNAKSFKDSNGDGVGDFQGLKDKEEYITDDLSTNAIWLSSIFQFGKDGGVVDHKALDSSFAGLKDEFISWVKKMRKDGTKVILDLVPNHTSRNHTWFKNSVAEKTDYKDYYVWAGQDKNTLPNQWKATNGIDSAWTYDDTRGAFYLSRVSGLPELNLANEKVQEEITGIMEYWFDVGVSGFNIRDLEHLVDNSASETEADNLMETLKFVEKLRKLADDFSDKPGRERVLIGAVTSNNRTLFDELWGDKEHKRLHIVTPQLTGITAACNAKCIKDAMEDVLSEDTKKEQWVGFQLSNGNGPRIATRLDVNGDGNYKHRLVNTYAVELLLPGTPFVYYGDEFGQRDGEGAAPDKFMAPMQWNKGDNAGFTDKGVAPWTPLSSTYTSDNVDTGRVFFTDMTPLQAFEKLTKLRKKESFQFGKTKLCTVGDNVLMFSRKASRFPYYVTIINMGKDDVQITPTDLACLPSKDEATVSFHSRNERLGDSLDLEDYGFHLDGFDVVVLQFPAED